MELVWSEESTARLRQVLVGWDGCEVGAPCFPPDWEPEDDDLALLQVATMFGDCAPGRYPYSPPPPDHEFSFFVQSFQGSEFDFRAQHRTLLKHMVWEMSDPYFGEEIPGCDPKRPYGNFTHYQVEMAQHLGLVPEQVEEEMTELHQQMQPALQVFLSNFSLAEGRRFQGDDMGNWDEI